MSDIANAFGGLDELPPMFSTRTLSEWSKGVFSERRLADMRRENKGPAHIKVPGGRQVLYTRASVADWLKTNMRGIE